MNITNTKLAGVCIVEPTMMQDSRGFFMESYNSRAMREHSMDYLFIQDNHSLSTTSGVIRGLHYQLSPKAQTKLIRVTAGAIYDVAVDIRRSSPTFGHWVGVHLSSQNKLQLLIPRGFAHGFCTTEPHTEVLYKVDEYYSPEHDRGIAWNDPALGIDWPTNQPLLSAKDQKHPLLLDAENDFE